MRTQQIRIGTLAGKGAETANYIRSIIPHGFECFQINFWKNLQGANLQKLSEELKDLLTESGTVISSLGVFGNPMESGNEAEECLDAWQQAIDSAHLFGTEIVAGFTGRKVGASIPDNMPRFKEVWGELAKRAEDKGVRIAFENCAMGGTWESGDWNVAHSPAAWELMFDTVDSASLGLEWEPCHQMALMIDPLPQLKKWLPKIFHVHGKDATIFHDVIRTQGISGPEPWCYHRTPGFGDTNWTDVISILRMGGYQGTIDIEGWHDPVYRDELEMTGQVHALNYLKNCRGGDII